MEEAGLGLVVRIEKPLDQLVIDLPDVFDGLSGLLVGTALVELAEVVVESLEVFDGVRVGHRIRR